MALFCLSARSVQSSSDSARVSQLVALVTRLVSAAPLAALAASRKAATKRLREITWRLLPGCVVILGCFAPIHHVPPCLEVIGAFVLVFQIVGVFPHVAAEDRLPFTSSNGFTHDRIVLVCRGNDLELAAVQHEPDPAAAEASQAGRFEFFLERVEADERRFEVIREFARGRAAGFW